MDEKKKTEWKDYVIIAGIATFVIFVLAQGIIAYKNSPVSEETKYYTLNEQYIYKDQLWTNVTPIGETESKLFVFGNDELLNASAGDTLAVRWVTYRNGNTLIRGVESV